MYCPFCHHELRSDSKPKFCVYCGQRLENVELLSELRPQAPAETPYKNQQVSPVQGYSQVSDATAESQNNSNYHTQPFTPVAPTYNNTTAGNNYMVVGDTSNQYSPDFTPSNKTPQPKKSKGPIIALIVGISVMLIAVAACLIWYCYPYGCTTGNEGGVLSKLNGMSGGASNISGQTNTEPAEDTKPENVYESIMGESKKLSQSESDDIQNELDVLKHRLGFNVVIMFTDSSSALDSVASSNIKSACGTSGILIVINERTGSCGVASCGSGDDYLIDAVKEAIKDSVYENIDDARYYFACIDAINIIPNSLDDLEIYNYKKVDGAEQVVYADSKKNELVIIDFSGTRPEKIFSTSTVYFGKDGLTTSPSEDKSATPLGTFRLGFAFSDESLNTGLDTEIIRDGMVWVNDPYSDYYNTLQNGSTSNSRWDSAENTYQNFKNNYYTACILIEHNGDGYSKGVSGKGSCIYISGKSDPGASYGDVNISAGDMRTILSLLDEDKDPHIVIS